MPHVQYAKQVETIARVLKRQYRDPRHHNKTNPLHELVFILLSVQTPERSYRNVYQSFRVTFPTARDVCAATERKIARTIHDAGLSTQRARAIREIYKTLARKFGRATLSTLESMSDNDAEAFLTSLPRVGTKIARCVLMYSIGRKVFPVDTHIWRIAKRIGWSRITTSDGNCRKKDMDRLQEKVPPKLRYSLHVNLIALGRNVCLPLKPKCGICPISLYCRRVSVPKDKITERDRVRADSGSRSI